MTMSIAVLRTPASNTGLDSQPEFPVGVDWLDVTFRGLGSGSDLQELLSDLEHLLKSPIDFSSTRSTFNGKTWKGSGRSESGALLWYNPPREGLDLLALDPTGNLFTHPGLLPPGCYSLSHEDIERVRAQLPPYAHLVHLPNDAVYVEPITGHTYPHHGYFIEPSGIPPEPSVGELKIAMGARVLDRVNISQIAEYLRIAGGIYVINCSRIDIAMDDNAKMVPLAQCYEASVAGDFFNVNYTKRVQSGKRGEPEGQTVYFGSSVSDAKMRVYDKTVESKGLRDCNRWEVEFHRKKADAMLHLWLEWMKEGEECAAQKMADVVVSFIDFRDRSSGDPNRARCPVLSWYAELCAAVRKSSARIRVPAPEQSIQKTVTWLGKSVAASLSSVSKVLGDDFFPYLVTLLKHGDAKMSNLRRKMAELTNKDELCYSMPGC